ncbi:hypothetical protein AMAG_06966 [Allomyces macrogynus ATCC 38327]|uniref:Uncharacterized protein n=1 Tax=Allomyces macrogynus (strain ATCC 38327) TaxID=578462 RepID=A0A0L0SFB1_ALLM3|nr:hypothetical protein AMAG_06966 [Allomyces macrogynus ATCC 38327]|eukprot:KNE61218.1 hypothetical protein AMAG_06966 [Allomyces macrogynus ATCC 38327]
MAEDRADDAARYGTEAELAAFQEREANGEFAIRSAPASPGGKKGKRASRRLSQLSNALISKRASYASIASVASGAPGATRPAQPPVDMEDLDSTALDDFFDFLSMSPTCTPTKMAALPFLARAMVADVEPCLTFTPETTRQCPVKKLVEAMLSAEVAVETYVPGSLPPRSGSVASVASNKSADAHTAAPKQGGGFFSSFMKKNTAPSPSTSAAAPPPPPPPTKCTLCGVHPDMPYVLRSPSVGAFPMCRFCRDRVVAACDFMAFARNLRAGHYNGQNMVTVWVESVVLRSRMLHARLGSLAVLEQPVAGVPAAAGGGRPTPAA